MGDVFFAKCHVRWCSSRISPFDFHVGHNVPHAHGGSLDLNNLRPICAKCNLSMGDRYTIDQWNNLVANTEPVIHALPQDKEVQASPAPKLSAWKRLLLCTQPLDSIAQPT